MAQPSEDYWPSDVGRPPPLRFPATADRPRPRRRWVVPVAALIAAAGLGAGIMVDRALRPANPFLEGGATHRATGGAAAPDAAGAVRVVETGTGHAVVLTPERLPAAPDGSYYAAWLRAPDGGVVPLGSFHERRTGIPIILWSGADPSGYPSFVVTLHAEGDAPAPTGDPVLTADLTG